MSKSGLTVLYELEVKAGVIDPDFTGNIGVVLKNNSDQLQGFIRPCCMCRIR